MTVISPFGIRRAAFIRASPERIWEEFSSFERMRAWYGTGHTLTEYQPKLGALVETTWVVDGVAHRARGEVLVFDPCRELSFGQRWVGADWRGEQWKTPATVTILLTPAGGGTLVELFHHGYELVADDPSELLSGFEDGWDTHHLEALRTLVER
jgi:uncharacterized protein YndB with AHSA1/START domain